MQIADKISDFIIEKFNIERDGDYSYDVNLFDYGYIDSLDATEIILFLEDNWNIKITQKDLIMHSMNTINELAEVVTIKTGASE
jgi:D-alanine--poly(phosphoribitol) ligase subunit 2